MQPRPTVPVSLCHGCFRVRARQHSSLPAVQQQRPESTRTFRNAPPRATKRNELRIKKHWQTDFTDQGPLTWASRSALHFRATDKNVPVQVFPVKRREISKGGRRRKPLVEDGIERPRARPLESPRLAGGNIRRSLRCGRGVEPAQGDALVPSPPSPPLGAMPNPPTAPSHISAQASPKKHVRLSLASRQDYNWYWDTLPPSFADKAKAHSFFTHASRNANLLRSAPLFRLLPDSSVPEVAFVGRSNVGKSSLLNALVSADIKALARTSARPGFTTTMNLYGIGPGNGVVLRHAPRTQDVVTGVGGLTIVDMPGYGAGSLGSWGTEIMKYVQNRRQLRRVFVLIDAQHGIKDKDRSLLASLRLAGVSHQVVLNKVDKLYIPAAKDIKRYDGKELARLRPKGAPENVWEVMEKIKAEVQPSFGGGALGEILACSAEVKVDGKRLGIDHVRYAVLKAVGLEGGAAQSEADAYHRVEKGSEKRIGSVVKDNGSKVEIELENQSWREGKGTKGAQGDAFGQLTVESEKQRRPSRR